MPGFANTPVEQLQGTSVPYLPPAVDDKSLTQPLASEYDKLKGRVKRLADKWAAEQVAVETRRLKRWMPIDNETERMTGNFKADEIYIPIHIINDNITKEAPQYIAYFKTSRNAATFKVKKNRFNPAQCVEIDVEQVENFFTQLFRYEGWEVPFFQVVDGAQTHGADSVEVVWDADKPGHFAIEHIARENLWFPEDTHHLQKAPIIVRNIKVTKEELLAFKEINLEQVELLFKDKEDKEESESTQDVQKVYYKQGGYVRVCWMSHSKGNYFLREPKQLYFGRNVTSVDEFSGIPNTAPIYETSYPIFVLPYMLGEDGKIINIKGRVKLDENVQEAASSLISSLINAWHRASHVMASPKNAKGAGQIEQIDVALESGRIYNESMEFWHQPYPDIGGMKIFEGLLTQNKAENSQTNFAVNNREDSRKTAEEIKTAKSQASMLSGVQVTLLGIFFREVCAFCWLIAKSQAEQGLLDYELPPQYLALDYDVLAAGDTEVIKRQETLQSLKELWPVISQTPAAMQVLKDILTYSFPDRAELYVQALQAGDTGKAKDIMLQSLKQILQQIQSTHPESIPAQDASELQLLYQNIDQLTASGNMQQQVADAQGEQSNGQQKQLSAGNSQASQPQA